MAFPCLSNVQAGHSESPPASGTLDSPASELVREAVLFAAGTGDLDSHISPLVLDLLGTEPASRLSPGKLCSHLVVVDQDHHYRQEDCQSVQHDCVHQPPPGPLVSYFPFQG